MSLFGKADGKSALKDVPIGIEAKGARAESDSMGSIPVPADRYWGAQTQRSLQHFSIGDDKMPKRVYHAYGYVKKAAAMINQRSGRLTEDKAEAIIKAADETIAGQLDEHYPLYVWQTGSGTQSNMNVNEVLSNRAIQLLGGKLGAKDPVHPNDHVNMGQSSNDTFPTAMHIAAVQELNETLIPQVEALIKTIEVKAEDWKNEVKIGRTHLEDAVPLTVGQEWSGYAAQLRFALDGVEASKKGLVRTGGGRHRRRHRAELLSRLQQGHRRDHRGVDRAAVHHGGQQVLRARLARPHRGGARGTARSGGGAHEDRQRHALAGERTTLRTG